MSRRTARPLRLLHSSLDFDIRRCGGRSLPLIAVYKPCGLPYFSASQMTSCRSGRHLFSTFSRDVTAVATNDMSDSLLGRATDMLPPGCGTPRVVFPIMHPVLLRSATASELNTITAQRKGVTLLATSHDEFMFFRNCHRLRLVRSVYRVLCRLPACVAARARNALRQANLSKQAARCAFKNPYVQDFLQRATGTTGTADGIPLGCDGGGDNSSNSYGSELPSCAYPHPLLQGGFINIKEQTLLRNGFVSGYMCSYRLPRGIQAAVKQQERLKGLFLSPTAGLFFSTPEHSKVANGCSVAEGRCNICLWKGSRKKKASLHPWIRDDCRMRFALDVKVASEKELASEIYDFYGDMDASAADLYCEGQEAQEGEKEAGCVVGKAFRFDFRLVGLSDVCDFALYEVSTNDASDEEIKAAFAAANFFVLNDFVNDIALSEAMDEVTKQLCALPQAKLAEFPLAFQHMLRHGSPVELVAEQLMLPTDSTVETMVSQSSSVPKQQAGFLAQRYRLLLEVLMNFKAERVYFCVAQLTLGGGLECTEVNFPDPSREENKSAVQHLLLQIEEGREVTETYRNTLAGRMHFLSRGTTIDCETYRVLLSDGDRRCIPSQRDVAVSWGGGTHPGVVRVEECGELWCAYCGAQGHVWGACPEGTPLLSPSEAGEEKIIAARNSDSSNGFSLTLAACKRDGETASADERLLTGGSELQVREESSDNMLLTTVDDVTDVLDDAMASKKNLDIISIPNSAPTRVFNPHLWLNNNKRPFLHRRRLRCAYCSGKHHITQCPKISDSDAGDCAVRELDREKLRANVDKLFCIKCGKNGHLYDSCPSVPRGLHTATHCPICLQPRNKIRHGPSQCPRRVTPPQEYLQTGVPAQFVKRQSGQHKLGRRGNGIVLADSFLSQT